VPCVPRLSRSLRDVDSGINHCAQRTTKSPANNPQQTWGFEGEPPEAVIEDLRILVREIRLHEDELQLHLIQLPVRHLLISDIGTDHLLTPLDGRSEVASRQNLWRKKLCSLRSTFSAIQSVLWREHDMVLALPCPVVQVILIL